MPARPSNIKPVGWALFLALQRGSILAEIVMSDRLLEHFMSPRNEFSRQAIITRRQRRSLPFLPVARDSDPKMRDFGHFLPWHTLCSTSLASIIL
jgi:hypothetical protein